MRFVIFLGVIFFSGCKTISQKSDVIKIVEISVYRDFQERGYTTAGAYTHIVDMKEGHVAQIIIDNESIKMLENILGRSKRKKHHQRKFGTRNVFGEILFAGSHNSHIVVIGDVGTVYDIFGTVKKERALLTDLTKMIDYEVTNLDDLKWLSDFIGKIKK